MIEQRIKDLQGSVNGQDAAARYFERGGEMVLDAVIALFEQIGPEWDVLRWDMGYALQLIGEREKTIAMLVDALRSADGSVRWGAADYIGYLDANDEPGILDALNDDDPDVRMAAAYVLQDTSTQVKREGAVDSLIAALDDPDPHVRLAVVKALYRTGSEACIAGLEQASKDPVGGVRTAARWAIKQLA